MAPDDDGGATLKRAVVYAAAIAALVTAGAMGPPEGLASIRLADSQTATSGDASQVRRERECRYQWVDKGTWTAREERRTALCVLERWSVPGGWTTFRQIIGCESGWYRKAYNPTGPYVGLGQHELSSWDDRVRTYMPDAWKTGPWTRWRNSRAMLATTAHMMHSVGLSPWGCA